MLRRQLMLGREQINLLTGIKSAHFIQDISLTFSRIELCVLKKYNTVEPEGHTEKRPTPP